MRGRVSVIVPVYNVRDYLSEALDSIICQSYTNLEVIVVDDGSTDGSDRICDEYAMRDNRISVIHQKNKGLSNARNEGLNRITGEVVAFLDSDDAYHQDYIKHMIDVMNSEEVDIVVCKYSVQYTTRQMNQKAKSDIRPQIKSGRYDRVGALQALVNAEINHSVWNKIYKKELWEKIRFPEGHVYEDANTTFQIMNLCSNIYVIDEVLYSCRMRSGSITSTYSKTKINDWLIACDNYNTFIRSNIPILFTDDQFTKNRQMQFYCLMNNYVQFTYKDSSKDKKYSDNLRDRIIELGEEVGIKHCQNKMRICYYMICKFPWLVKFFYPIYSHYTCAIRILRFSKNG